MKLSATYFGTSVKQGSQAHALVDIPVHLNIKLLNQKMKKHIFWMVIGCGLPLLLIFFAPALGLSSGTSLFIFIVGMFACHLLMPMHHHGNSHEPKQDSVTTKTESYEHQH